MNTPARLDSAATAGVLFSALATALPCCLPLLASVGAVLGLGVLAPYQGGLIWLLQGLVVLALLGHVQSFRRHRNACPLALAAASAAALLYAYNTQPTAPWVYGGLTGLAAAAAWTYLDTRRRGACPGAVRTRSTLTCPHCGLQTTETMPTDACLYFHECPGCKTLLKPKPGDCCVFCSYGDVLCPPKQANSPCCT
jgi:hypothetical protein